MTRCGRGYTLVEILVGVVMLGIIAGVSLPSFVGFMERSRLDAAVRQLAEDVREARSRATTKGWEYRIFGYNSTGTSPFRNQYRLMGRSSAAIAWPADTATSFESATQLAGVWINFNTAFPGVRVNPEDGSPRFWVAFNARGIAYDMDASFDPLRVTSQAGQTMSLSVTTAGSIRIQ